MLRNILILLCGCVGFAAQATVTLTYTGSPCIAPFVLSFQATSSLPDTPNTITWTFGDGSMATTSGETNTIMHIFTYAAPVYYVTATFHYDGFSEEGFVFAECNPANPISGIVYQDANSDCIADSTEAGISGIPVHIFSAGGSFQFTTFSGLHGQWQANLSPDTLWTVATQAGAFNTTCPPSGEYSNVDATDSIATHLDFGGQCSTSTLDQSVMIGGTGEWLSVLAASDAGCTTEPATIILTLPGGVTAAFISQAPDSTSGNQWFWNNISFASFYVGLWYQADTALYAIGDTLCFSVDIIPISTDSNLANNHGEICLPYTASYDPNNKLALPTGDGPQGYIPDSAITLTYIINFQNTGTDTASSVVLRDTLSANLDPTSIKLIGASHPVSLSQSGGVLGFSFPGIQLPDSNVNEPASHGHVVFSVKAMPALGPGTPIQNTASIYFDANFPVVTNTTLNTIALQGSTAATTAPPRANPIQIHPNPTPGPLHVTFPQDYADWQITITDARGITVLQPKAESPKQTITLQAAPGLYLVRATNTNTGETFATKVVLR